MAKRKDKESVEVVVVVKVHITSDTKAGLLAAMRDLDRQEYTGFDQNSYGEVSYTRKVTEKVVLVDQGAISGTA